MKFRRSLSARALKTFLHDQNFIDFLAAIKRHPELSVQLRQSRIDVYLSGFVVFSLSGSGRLQIGSLSDRGSKNTIIQQWSLTAPRSITDLSINDVDDYIGHVKSARAKRIEKSKELYFELKLVHGNQVATSKVFTLDRQIVKPKGGLSRLDLLMYDIDAERLVLAELKLATNQELRKDVFEQLDRYRILMKTSPEIAIDYEQVFLQKRELGLIAHDLAAIDVSSPPLLLLLIADYGNHPSKEQGIIKSALNHKPAELEFRVRDWEGLPEDPAAYRFDKPTSTLPGFEEWARSRIETKT